MVDWIVPIGWIALVALIGVLVGAGEIVGRYRDAPHEAIFSVPASLYLLVNAAASITAYALMDVLGIDLGIDPATQPVVLHVVQVLVAGFGAMALFRTSIFVVRVAGQDIGIGPSSFLQIILSATDRAIDRARARERASHIGGSAAVGSNVEMSEIDWEKANSALPTYCLNLMQNLSVEDQQALAVQLDALRKDQTMTNELKVYNMGLLLMNQVGSTVLQEATKSLGTLIMTSEAIARRTSNSSGGLS